MIDEKTPLVSVIITTQKGSDSIERAIKSVLAQDYTNLEVIVVDDNGLGTEEQVKTAEIAAKYESVKYIPHEHNQNGSVARNTGAKNSHGKYLSFLDDDDEFLPGKISKQVEVFEKADQNCGLVYCSFTDEFDDGRKIEYVADKNGKIVVYSLLNQIKVPTSLFMVKKDVFDELSGFDESFKRHQDWEFVARLTDKYMADYVSDFCVIKHSIGRNNQPNAKTMEANRLHYLNKLKDIIDSKDEKKQIYCHHYYAFVKQYIKEGNIGKFFEYLVKSRAPLTFVGMFFKH